MGIRVRSELLLGVTVAACACHRSPAVTPTPEPAAAGVRTISVPVTTLDTTNPLMRAAIHRADSASAAVDTILVHPDSLLLHVGQPVLVSDVLVIEARTAAGARVQGFAPFLGVEDYSVAGFEPAGLVGRRVGRTHLVIRPMARDPSMRVRDIRATVILRVVP